MNKMCVVQCKYLMVIKDIFCWDLKRNENKMNLGILYIKRQTESFQSEEKSSDSKNVRYQMLNKNSFEYINSIV